MGKEMLEAALKYRELGLSVFPVNPKDKTPAVPSWLKYQTKQASIEEITEWFGKMNHQGIAIVTGKLSNLFVVDFDKYKPEFNEEITLQYFPDTIETPTVKTISGGLHLYFEYPDQDISIRAAVLPGVDCRGQGGYIVAPPTKNITGSTYEWIVDLTTPKASLPNAFINLLKDNKYLSRARVANLIPNDFNSPQASTLSTNVYKQGSRDQDLFHIANLLVKARCEPEYLYKTLEILALNCDPPFPLNEALDKIKSAIERANRKERNLAAEVREYVLSTNGIFLSTDVAKCLLLSTRDDLKNLSIILKRLEKNEKIIEKHGNRNGCYRTIDQEEELIDIFNVDLAPSDVVLPLRIHEYVTIHKSNVIIIAGESNSGKTSFCLNVARMNRDRQRINYLSSEMQDGTELRIRLNEFEEDIEKWRSVKFEFRTDDFPGKIMPDDLNIVDYLDEGSDAEAYKMPSRIKEISKRLKNGVAVIAIQKDPNKTYGYGGAGTLNRSRLYLTTTTKGIMTIIKGKIWRNKLVNPNGMFCKYKLVAGCKYIQDGDWMW